MKIRTDFVTNSSSSSFIFVLDHEIKDVTEIPDVLNIDEQYRDWDDTVSGDDVASYIFNHMDKIESLDDIKRQAHDISTSKINYFSKDYSEARRENIESEETQKLIELTRKKHVYQLEAEDDEDIGRITESNGDYIFGDKLYNYSSHH